MTNSPLSQISAQQIAHEIRSGKLTCLEVADFFINAQKKWNPKLNALVENRWDEVRREAREKDQWRAENPEAELPPLFGVPITVKEMISIQGFRCTLGSIHRRRHVQTRDASVIERLRKAGALILGTTNVPELGFWFECENPVYGMTSNPYDLERSSGGSSGGEAALIAAGASPLGFGSDVGGSIRMPAGFCGIFGHKPSNRIVPVTGHYPADHESMPNMRDPLYPLTVIGPMSKKSEDLRPALELLIGPDGLDPEVKTDFKLEPPITDWSDSTVWLLPRPVMSAVSLTEESMVQAVRLSGQYFESLGAKVKEIRPDFFKNAVFLWASALSKVEGRSFEEALFQQKKPNLGLEFIRTLFGVPHYTLPSLMTLLTERFMASNQEKWAPLNEDRHLELEKMQRTLNTLLKGKHLLITPVHPRVAPKHRSTYTRPFDFAMTGIFNALGVPVTTAPISWKEGLPQSVQIVSAWGQDHVCLSAAGALEFGFGGWRPPPEA